MTSQPQQIVPSVVSYEQAANGPRVLFFSGGTALTALSHRLIHHTHNSIHIISAFDSGGSSAALRTYFDMPALGDIRSRLIALADISRPQCVAVRDLLSYRLSYIGSNSLLLAELQQIASGDHLLLSKVDSATKQAVCAALQQFLASMPPRFELGGASVGNLVLAGRYLEHNASLADIVAEVAQWLGVLGTVRLVVDESFHLAATLASGALIVGQHLITGKECEPISAPITRLQLSASAATLEPVQPVISQAIADHINSADLICYPPGSFYTSLIATLLPDGVAQAIANNPAPKVFIPNMGTDPEQFGIDTIGAVQRLLHYLGAGTIAPAKLLNYVLVDPRIGEQAIATLIQVLEPQAITLLRLPELQHYQDGYYDPEELAKALTTLAVS